jgi:O-antigen biosynthesis protein WbqP
MKRIFDFIFAFILLILFIIPMILIALSIRLTSNGPAIYWSDRVGVNNLIFRMPKFRSMRIDTPSLATHLLSDPDKFLSPIGKILRKSSIDELPQIFSVLQGDMSFVGPRPALYNQDDLVSLRKEYGLEHLVPGITGWAQVNGRDNLTIYEKVMFEVDYNKNKSFWFDLKILWLTVLKVFSIKQISH